MAIGRDPKFTEFPGRNTPLLDRPFGNASPGCFIFARDPQGLGLHFPVSLVSLDELPPPKPGDQPDNFQWSLGSVTTPLIPRRYSHLTSFQMDLAENLTRGSDTHVRILESLRDRNLTYVPSRMGVEATVIDDDGTFAIGIHHDLKINRTTSPIPYSGFPVADDADNRTAYGLIVDAVVEMCRKQLSLSEESVRDGVFVHTIYTLGRRLQTQIACTVDLRGTGINSTDIELGYQEAEEGPSSFPNGGRHREVEFRAWDQETIERFAGSNSYRPTKQNLSSVFFAAANDGLITEDRALELVGVRDAGREIEIAELTGLNRILDRPTEVPDLSAIGPLFS